MQFRCESCIEHRENNRISHHISFSDSKNAVHKISIELPDHSKSAFIAFFISTLKLPMQRKMAGKLAERLIKNGKRRSLPIEYRIIWR